jgi:hypothetical protein
MCFGILFAAISRYTELNIISGRKLMIKLSKYGWLALALWVNSASYADIDERSVEISEAWTRATAPGQETAGVDLTISSKFAATLVGASSPVAGSVALHSMTSEGGMMRMNEVQSIELPAGKHVNLEESGYHLMLDGLKAPLKEGDYVPLTLSFKTGKQGVMKIEAKAVVKSAHTIKASPKEDHQHMHMNMN